MNLRTAAVIGMLGMVCVAVPSPEGRPAESPYAGQEQRAIKTLSAEDVRALQAGEGMGLAKAAELNRYPGPRHVLELAEPLGLTQEQRADIGRIYGQMHGEATALAQEILALERGLDAAFRTGTIQEDELDRLTGALGRLQGRLRASHLRAHLKARASLTASQVERYWHLRGYGNPASEASHGAHDPNAHTLEQQNR